MTRRKSHLWPIIQEEKSNICPRGNKNSLLAKENVKNNTFAQEEIFLKIDSILWIKKLKFYRWK